MPNNKAKQPVSLRQHRSFWHLTDKDCQIIETWYKRRVSLREVERRLIVLRHHLPRNQERHSHSLRLRDQREFEIYSADYASERHAENMTTKGPNLKIGYDHTLVEIIDLKHFIPAVRQRLILDVVDVRVCQRTLYNYVYGHEFPVLTDRWYRDLTNLAGRVSVNAWRTTIFAG